MPSKPKVYFFYQNVQISLSNRSGLKKFIESIFKKEVKRLASVNYIFVSDKALLEINKQFLKHNFYTDIITFDLSESTEINAEIYVSVDRVRENAKILKVSFKSELHRVIFHGALHLCGYGDKTKAQKNEMSDKEDFYLDLYLKIR
ncbi:MAG: rRNA maturation RNase YbeY [Chitinophagaceae bacterium]|mgnify:FL=1|nr:rRNA maturation RNase YbeY [Chitinophagaceae bacterium]